MPDYTDDPEEIRRRNNYYSQSQVGQVGMSETEIRAIFALIGMLAFAGAVIWVNHKYGDRVFK